MGSRASILKETCAAPADRVEMTSIAMRQIARRRVAMYTFFEITLHAPLVECDALAPDLQRNIHPEDRGVVYRNQGAGVTKATTQFSSFAVSTGSRHPLCSLVPD